MKSLAFQPQNYYRFQILILTLLAALFTGGLAAILIELSNNLPWTRTTFFFVLLMSIPYPISFAWIWLEYLRFKQKAEKLSLIRIEHQPDLFCKQLNLLSAKEQKVYSLIKERKSNKEICSELFIEHSTLKSHINHIYKKLEIKSRKEMTYLME